MLNDPVGPFPSEKPHDAVVRAMTLLMREKFREKEARSEPGHAEWWRKYYAGEIVEEVGELILACRTQGPREVALEAADVANVAALVAYRALQGAMPRMKGTP